MPTEPQHRSFQPMLTAGLSADALRFSTPALRQSLQAWFAWVNEVMSVPSQVTEPSVALAKLDWWQQEVKSAAATGQASHPALQPLLPMLNLQAGLIHAHELILLIEGCIQSLRQTRFLDETAFAHHVRQTSQVAWSVAARLGAAHTAKDKSPHTTDLQLDDFAAHLAQFFAWSSLIGNMGWDARHGRLLVPMSLLQQVDIKAHELLSVHQPLRERSADFQQRYQTLCQTLQQQATMHLQQALSNLPSPAWRHQKPLLIEASIRQRWMLVAAQSGFDLLHQQLQLSPFAQFWQAWKMQALNRF